MSHVLAGGERDVRVLVLAPRGQDERAICAVLQQAGVHAESYKTVENLVQQVQAGAGAAVLTTEALSVARIRLLGEVVDRQPTWSALPFLLLTSGGASTRASLQQLALLGQLQTSILLERPLRKVTLVSAVQAALRLRRRQYEIRDYLVERERREALLRRTNEELRQFSYIASHDLQEPLRTISNYMQLLALRAQGKLDPDMDQCIGFAVDGAQRMQVLINDLLAYTRVETQGAPLAKADGEAVLTQALRDLQQAIAQSGAEVTYDPLPTVTAVPGQLRQVFENLLSNALKFRGQEPPRVHLSAQRQGRAWLFSVRDNGIGLDPKHAERIFQIFQRLHTRREYPGTGIGLAICKKIVERHGGRIWVESEVGKGTTFFFTLGEEEQGSSP